MKKLCTYGRENTLLKNSPNKIPKVDHRLFILLAILFFSVPPTLAISKNNLEEIKTLIETGPEEEIEPLGYDPQTGIVYFVKYQDGDLYENFGTYNQDTPRDLCKRGVIAYNTRENEAVIYAECSEEGVPYAETEYAEKHFYDFINKTLFPRLSPVFGGATGVSFSKRCTGVPENNCPKNTTECVHCLADEGIFIVLRGGESHPEFFNYYVPGVPVKFAIFDYEMGKFERYPVNQDILVTHPPAKRILRQPLQVWMQTFAESATQTHLKFDKTVMILTASVLALICLFLWRRQKTV